MTKKLSVAKLKQIIKEELESVKEEFEAKSLEGKGVDKTDADETDADELADSAPSADGKAIGEVKRLKLREAKLLRALKQTIVKKNRILRTL